MIAIGEDDIVEDDPLRVEGCRTTVGAEGVVVRDHQGQPPDRRLL